MVFSPSRETVAKTSAAISAFVAFFVLDILQNLPIWSILVYGNKSTSILLVPFFPNNKVFWWHEVQDRCEDGTAARWNGAGR
jgi:hypothetical protein